MQELENSQEDVKKIYMKFLELPDCITKVKVRLEVASKEIETNFDKKMENLEKDIAKLDVRLHSHISI